MRLGRAARAAVAVSLALGVAPGAPASQASVTPATTAARERLLDRVVEADGLVERLRERFGRRLGPTYYADSPAGRVFTVGIVGRTGADERAVRELAGVPGLVDVRTARYTTDEVREFAGRVDRFLAAAGQPVSYVGIEAPLLPEKIVVGVRAPLADDVRRALRDVAPVPVELRAAGSRRFVHDVSRLDFPPYEAGLRFLADKYSNATFWDHWIHRCATGFTAYSPTTRRYYGTSAGHCGPTDSTVLLGRQIFLPEDRVFDQNGYYDPDDGELVTADAARFPIKKSEVTTTIARGPRSHLTVNGRYDAAGIRDRFGKRMCWVSADDDAEYCGELRHEIVFLHKEFNDDVDNHLGLRSRWAPPPRELRNVFCVETSGGAMRPEPGDSGGPVYSLNKVDETAVAAGLLLFHHEFRDSRGDVTGEGACFQPLDALERELEVEIMFDGWANPDAQSNSSSWSPAPSGDGRFVAFSSAASNLVDSDANGAMDVFVRDKVSQVTERVSVSSAEQQGNDASGLFSPPAISDDGRYVLFESEATNLVAGDTNGLRDVFVRDRQNGTTTRVSVSSSGQQATGGAAGAFAGEISAGGRFVTFASNATNLVAGGNPNGHQHVYRRDLLTGTTEVVSAGLAGQQANSSSVGGPVSTDGRYVAFFSYAQNLVPGQTGNPNLDVDVFVRDMVDDTTVMASMTPGGMRGNASAGDDLDMSDDARYVTFESWASNLVFGDTNGQPDVFVRDMFTNATKRVSVSTAGAQGNSWSSGTRVSGLGRYVAFVSGASNLVPGDTNGIEDVFLHDLTTGTTRRMSLGSEGQQQRALGDPDDFATGGIGISANGNHVAFSTPARLVPGDTQTYHDVYQRNWPANLTILVSQP